MKCQNDGRLAEAEQIYRAILASEPDHTDALLSLGDVLKLQNRLQEAAQAFRDALDLKPQLFPALTSLADILSAQGQMDESEEYYLRALQLKPDSAETHFMYGNLLLTLGRTNEAIASYRRALECDPELWWVHSNLAYTLNFSADYTPEEVFREHLEWARRHAEPLKRSIKPPRNSKVPDRRLRIGYVSPNFRDHAVSCFFEPTLKHHDYSRFNVFCYSDVSEPDRYTHRMRGYPCVWRDVAGQRSEAVARLVAADEIDILVDLSGHTSENRLLVFARKPAPIQVTWNGYPNTTGMDAMDYRITDAYADPPGMTEHLHTEKLVRLPEIYMAYQPPEQSPPVVAPPCLAKGYITFGSFNALSKIGPQVIAAWAQILKALPTARLTILTLPEGKTRARMLQAFAEEGVEPDRLTLIGRLPAQQFLAAHQRVDIALDPFPFHGTTTSCHTLWMGVPLITLAGRSHVSRVGVSMLSNLGLERLIARNEQEYVSIAIALAGNRQELATLRAGLRERMLASPNTDGARATRFLEAAYAKMWKDYCFRTST